MTRINCFNTVFFSKKKYKCCLTTRVTVDVLLQPDMLLIGLSCVVRHGLADMERSQVTLVTLVLDTSTAQSRLT